MAVESRDRNGSIPAESAFGLDAVLVDLGRLTDQQQSVLREFVREPNDDRIARRLDLSPQTVRNHLARIQKKLKVSGRAELMKIAIVGLFRNGQHGLG